MRNHPNPLDDYTDHSPSLALTEYIMCPIATVVVAGLVVAVVHTLNYFERRTSHGMDFLPQAIPRIRQRAQALPINCGVGGNYHSRVGSGGALPDEIRKERC
jgi:hypothetical protein